MSIKGSPYMHFKNALRLGDLSLIRMAALDLPRVALDDALRVCLLMAEQDHASFDRAATRWLGRFALEAPDVGLEDLDEALSAFAVMRDQPVRARGLLVALGNTHGLRL